MDVQAKSIDMQQLMQASIPSDNLIKQLLQEYSFGMSDLFVILNKILKHYSCEMFAFFLEGKPAITYSSRVEWIRCKSQELVVQNRNGDVYLIHKRNEVILLNDQVIQAQKAAELVQDIITFISSKNTLELWLNYPQKTVELKQSYSSEIRKYFIEALRLFLTRSFNKKIKDTKQSLAKQCFEFLKSTHKPKILIKSKGEIIGNKKISLELSKQYIKFSQGYGIGMKTYSFNFESEIYTVDGKQQDLIVLSDLYEGFLLAKKQLEEKKAVIKKIQ